MDKIKRYIDCYVPITTCTLRCHYCYIVQHGLFANKVPKLKYSAETVRKALSKERLGGTCLINFCAAGETLISKELLEYVRAILEEGHYVMVVTNATISKRFDEIISFPPELLKRLFFKFSYHYLELKEKNLLERFFSNIKKIRDVGCSFTLEVTPSDELIPFIDEMNQKSGDWSFYLNLGTGIMTQCYKSLIHQNIFEDVEKPINFCPIGNNCLEYHCYNGHSYIVLGDIPELDAPTYAELRNRICNDGSEWLKPEMKSFMSTKLYESNKEYTEQEKEVINKRIYKLAVQRKLKEKVGNSVKAILKHIIK